MSAEHPVDFGDDPRMHAEHVRYLPEEAGDVTLAGVVHDHPASRYRVRELVDRWEPDVLAVEVAPLALTLFEQYAADGRDLPTFGGEVSAAIAAAEDARVVGIDGVDATFLRELARTVASRRPSVSTVGALFESVASVARHACGCRTAATGVRLEVDDPVTHETTLSDPPAAQADDERSQLSRIPTLLRCASPPEPIALRDETRDRCMARRIDALRAEGDVLAVVGRGHLVPLTDRLGD